MIRRNPEALAIALILLLIPVSSLVSAIQTRIERAVLPAHRELRIQRDNFRAERDQIREEIRENIREAFRFNCI